MPQCSGAETGVCKLTDINKNAGKTETNTINAPGGPPQPAPAAVIAKVPQSDGDDPIQPVLSNWQVDQAAAAESSGDPDPAAPPPCADEPVAINESNGYRYLGLRFTSDLSDTQATSRLIKSMDLAYYRYFCFCLTIRRCSPTLQLQLLQSNIIGPIVYLLSILNVSSAKQAKFDSRLRKYGRHIFGLPRGTPDSITTAITRIGSFNALQCRERARLCLQLIRPLNPQQSIANAVYLGVLAENIAGQSLALANLPVRFKQQLQKLQNVGVEPPPANPLHYRAAVEAGLFGDRVASHEWQRESRITSGVRDPPRADRPRRGSAAVQQPSQLKLPRALPTEHAADIYFGFIQSTALPLMHGLVPLSYLGAGGTSIVALSNKIAPIVAVVARLQTGNVALRRFPWRARNPERPAPRTGSGLLGADDELSDVDTESSDSSSSDDDSDGGEPDLPPPSAHASAASAVSRRGRSRRLSSASRGRRSQSQSYVPSPDAPRAAYMECRLCGSGHEHPAHIFFECTAGTLPELRRGLLDDALTSWLRKLDRLDDAVKCYNREETAFGTPQARAALGVAFNAEDKREAQWLTHRLLWAIPWPESAVPSDATAARALGTVFDRTILSRHALRPLADAWVTWSHKWTCRFGATWAALLRAAAAADADA